MLQKTKTILGIVALAAIIGGSTLLYQTLEKSYTPQNNIDLAAEEQSTSISKRLQNPSDESPEAPTSGEPEKMLAPAFSVVDEAGNTVQLSDFVGKPVVINFWASWCPPCKAEMPEFDAVWEEVGEDIAFLMINATDGVRETEEKAKKYIAEQGFSFPVYYDTTQEVSYAYGISSLPTTLFIDKDGYLITGTMGMIDEDTLRKGIALIQPSNATEKALNEPMSATDAENANPN